MSTTSHTATNNNTNSNHTWYYKFAGYSFLLYRTPSWNTCMEWGIILTPYVCFWLYIIFIDIQEKFN
jgi:hypothetical protein